MTDKLEASLNALAVMGQDNEARPSREEDVRAIKDALSYVGVDTAKADWLYHNAHAALDRLVAAVATSKAVDCYRCGQPACCEQRPINIPSEFEPFCRSCADYQQESTQEVADHEMRVFGGTYGVPGIEERPLSHPRPITPPDNVKPLRDTLIRAASVLRTCACDLADLKTGPDPVRDAVIGSCIDNIHEALGVTPKS